MACFGCGKRKAVKADGVRSALLQAMHCSQRIVLPTPNAARVEEQRAISSAAVGRA
jgi:hypothetical protein